ncbi:acyltransferase family protein [Ligilactobacillus salivarius]|uniref:acyltransferase n=1 Tax=Ligilactobacillus salivarius TaxID=1624 RepID=UPI003977B35C
MKRRNYGIDLLRIVAMYMIVLYHCLLLGGAITKATQIGIGSINYDISWLLDTLCYCAVNCYALISGYVGVKSKFKLQNIIKLWFQVLFYSVVLNIIIWVTIPNVPINKGLLIQMLMPISFERYWYFSAYFILFAFMPFLNLLLNNLDKSMATKLLITLILVCSFGETFIFRAKTFLSLQSGYSAPWLIILYLIGGYIKLYGWKFWKHDKTVYFSMAILSFAVFLLLGGEQSHGRVLINYPAPTMLFMGIALLNIFSKLSLNSRIIQGVKLFAPLTFGVYLIHIHPFVAEYLFKDRFADIALNSPVMFIGKIVIFSLCIYLICSVIELVRAKLFELLKLNVLANAVAAYIQKHLEKLI